MYLHLQDYPLTLSLARFLLCGLLLLIPSTFMGATLPVLTRWYSLRGGRIGRSIASLYAINSAGAGAGALLVRLRAAAGPGGDLDVAAGVRDRHGHLRADAPAGPPSQQRLPWTEPHDPKAASAGKTRRMPDVPLSAGWHRGLLLAYGLSGAAALVYEVAWTRALALVVGSTTYAFSLMLAAFILGLAIGSAIMVRLIDRIRNRLYWFAIVEMGIGLSAMVALPVFGQMPVWIVKIVREHRESFATLQAVEFGLMLLVMMVPTTLMGAAFPLVSRAYATGADRVGHSVGSVYAANTVGGDRRHLRRQLRADPADRHAERDPGGGGSQHPDRGVVLVVLWSGQLGAAGRCWQQRWRRLAGLVRIGLPPWDPSIMTSGAYLYADRARGQGGRPGVHPRADARRTD